MLVLRESDRVRHGVHSKLRAAFVQRSNPGTAICLIVLFAFATPNQSFLSQRQQTLKIGIFRNEIEDNCYLHALIDTARHYHGGKGYSRTPARTAGKTPKPQVTVGDAMTPGRLKSFKRRVENNLWIKKTYFRSRR